MSPFVATAIAMTLLPILAGSVAGRVVRSASPGWRRVTQAWAVAAIALMGNGALGLLGLWDLLWTAVFAVLGFGLGVGGVEGNAAARALVGMGLAAVVAEAAGRAVLPPAPYIAPPYVAPLAPLPVDEPGQNPEVACDLLFPSPATARAAIPDPASTVVHFGDSMVHGLSISEDDRFVGRLDARDAVRSHVAVATPGIAPDVLTAAAPRWLAHGAADLAVLYVFGGNDSGEMGMALPCCPEGVIDIVTGAPRCAEPAPLHGLARTLYRSPPPWPLWEAAEYSRVAAWTVAWMAWRPRAGGDLVGRDDVELQTARIVDQAHRFAAWQAARGTRTQVVFLSLPRGDSVRGREASDLIRAGLAASDLPWIDSTPWVDAFMDAGLPLLQDDGVHWTAQAHGAFAAWLAPQLLPPSGGLSSLDTEVLP